MLPPAAAPPPMTTTSTAYACQLLLFSARVRHDLGRCRRCLLFCFGEMTDIQPSRVDVQHDCLWARSGRFSGLADGRFRIPDIGCCTVLHGK
mmetsp:Transcript_21633/g.44390  ORF Transcript_21633/g.44390 Transcript_21633/m.44390 type:complete len:92 (-) Transcript_21633:22-297(-)